MKKSLCQFIYYKILGWNADLKLPEENKYVICAAPHTSNWDFVLGKIFACTQGLKLNYLIKKECFIGPFKYLFRKIGGIPVERKANHSLVENLSEMAKQSKVFHLVVTPEGTRAANPNWKSGFYYIAQLANIPIILIALDYKKKCITANKIIVPTGNVEQDMQEIKEYFSQFQGKNPQNFAI